MTIHGYFTDLNNNTIGLEIVNSSLGEGHIDIGTNGLFFAGDPITISTTNDNTFEHIIKKSATINLVTKDYVGKYFFADNARSVNVTIKRNDDIVFYGYLEPNTFSQAYSLPLEEFTLNCTDYLSTLQYLNYGNANLSNYDTLKQTATNKSFKKIIEEIFAEAHVSTIIWYDKSKAVKKGRETTTFEDLGINENYIYGDEFDDIMTQEELLNEILQYLNLHILQNGKDFYIFDWNTIKNENTEWVNILSGNYPKATQNTPIQHITMKSEHHADNGTNITVSDVFNQIQVKCELEDQETVIESPLDKGHLSSHYKNRFHYMDEIISENADAFLDMVDGHETTHESNKKIIWYMQPMYNSNWKLNLRNGQTIDSLVTYDKNNEAIDAYRLADYVKRNQLTPMLVKFGSVESAEFNTKDNTPVSSITMKNYLYISINGNADNTDSGASPTPTMLANSQPLIEYVGSNGGGIYSPNDDDTTNYIVFSGRITLQPIQWENDHYYNILNRKASGDAFTTAKNSKKYSVGGKVPVDGGKKYYTRKFYMNKYPNQDTGLFSSRVYLQPPVKDMQFKFDGDKYGSSDFKYEYSAAGDGTDKYSKLPILECELIIGNKRLVEYDFDKYGNSKFKWCDIDSGVNESYVDTDGITKDYLKQTFSIGVNPNIGDVILGNEFDMQRTVDYRMNIDAKGMAIPIKKSDNLSGAVIFRILGPINLVWNDTTRRHPTFFRKTKWYDSNKIILCHLENIIISDFEAKVYTDGAGITNNDDNDLIYMSNENNKYYNKKDDITFKFITQLTSKECNEKGISPSVCLNSVIDMNNNLPINSIYNATTDEQAKAEEHYVDQYYTEYSKPKIIMETTLHDNKDIDFRNIFISTALAKNFYVQSISQDIRQATATITLKEL